MAELNFLGGRKLKKDFEKSTKQAKTKIKFLSLIGAMQVLKLLGFHLLPRQLKAHVLQVGVGKTRPPRPNPGRFCAYFHGFGLKSSKPTRGGVGLEYQHYFIADTRPAPIQPALVEKEKKKTLNLSLPPSPLNFSAASSSIPLLSIFQPPPPPSLSSHSLSLPAPSLSSQFFSHLSLSLLVSNCSHPRTQEPKNHNHWPSTIWSLLIIDNRKV